MERIFIALLLMGCSSNFAMQENKYEKYHQMIEGAIAAKKNLNKLQVTSDYPNSSGHLINVLSRDDEYYSLLQRMLDNQADPNLHIKPEWTPLENAINFCALNNAALLLERGAQPLLDNLKLMHNQSPKGNKSIRLLIQAGATFTQICDGNPEELIELDKKLLEQRLKRSQLHDIFGNPIDFSSGDIFKTSNEESYDAQNLESDTASIVS